MLLKNRAEQTIGFLHLKAGESSFLTFVSLQVERANGSLALRDTVVSKDVDAVFETAVDVRHYRRV